MKPQRILLFYPPNKRSVAIETLCKTVKEAGHELLVLIPSERGLMNEVLEAMGIKTYNYVLPRKPSWKFFTGHIRNLIRFCRKNKIDYVWSHLQEANLVALFSRPFIKAKVVCFRHHAESAFYAEMGEKFGMQRNKNEVRVDRLVNKLANKIVIPSSGVWNSMEKYEGCNMKKVVLLPYIYDFSTYQKPDAIQIKLLRDKYPCKLMLIMVSRMVPSKQHGLVFDIVNKIVKEGLLVKMIVMDDGPLRPVLEKFITDNDLADHLIMTGFRDDFVNYMGAADLLIHPSVTEASNSVVKEMGLMEKAVAVCRHVGDFSDYIEDDKNGYFLERNNLEETIEHVIRDAYNNAGKLERFGKQLKKDVLHRFSDSPGNKQRILDLLN